MIPVADLIGQLPVHPTKKYPPRRLTDIRYLAIHHTAGPSTQTPEAIARYHVETDALYEGGAPGIGYHYLVGAGGTIWKVNPASVVAACVRKGNTRSLCVCLIGNFTDAPPPEAQWQAAVGLVRWLKRIYPAEVFGHREVPTVPAQKTACPGAKFSMAAFRAAVDAPREGGLA